MGRTLCIHSSQFQSLCSTKSSSKTLENLPYFICTKTQSCCFRFSFRATLFFSLIKEKKEKQLWVFIYIKYGKFSSVLLELFVKHKLGNWEELRIGLRNFFCQKICNLFLCVKRVNKFANQFY